MNAFWTLIDNDLSVPLFGAPLTVMGMAFGGTLASFAYGPSEPSRKRLFTLTVTNTFISTVLVAVFPPFVGWEWVTPSLAPPLAGALAFSLRFIIPSAIELVPKWLNRFASSRISGEVE